MIEEKVILMVEDNPKDEMLTLLALRKSNVLNEVVVARDGVEALDYLFARGAYSNRNPNELPAIVLLDLKLPKVDGLEVLRSIRSEATTRYLPVIVFTSSNEERDIVESYSSGCNSYVQKPVDFIQFADAVKQLGLYWLVINNSAPAQRA
jgi:two-component system response regulator